MTRTIQSRSDQSEATLQDCFDYVDWDITWTGIPSASENNIDLYADSVSEYIRKCIGDVVPTVTIKTYPKQKPWMDGGIVAKLNSRTIAFNHGKRCGNMAEYKQCSYSLRKEIKQAKCRVYRKSQNRNQPRHASRQTKHLLCPL